MSINIKSEALSRNEVIFQVILHLLVFIFYSYDRHQHKIDFFQIVFFLNSAFAAFLINYFLLPKFLYRKKYLLFGVGLLLIITGVLLIEELVLEQIYFPDTRGQYFPGVIFSLLGVLPVMGILSGFKLGWDAMGKQQEVDQLKATIKESELLFLRSQINPHFLFNNLNNLYSYAIENSPKTPSIILELSSVLRYMLYECKEKYVPLVKEIEHLRNFTRLNEMQIEERGKVIFDSPAIEADYEIAPLILIVFIENAFKHSQASQSANIHIEINIQLSDQGELHFTCKNNFQPVTNTNALERGIGLENVKKRLQLIYPDVHQLKIEESDNQFEVQLSLRLNKTQSKWPALL